jgi:hypothetical protein
VSIEKEIRGRFEGRWIESISEKKATTCGFRDPVSSAGWKFSWMKLEKVASCVTNQSSSVLKYRDLKTPSFIERGEEPH